MKKLISASLILTAALITGCGMQGGSTIVKHESGTPSRTTEVTQAGTYALYDSYDTTPQITVPLDRGDEIGFRQDNDTGKTVAVAGSKTYPIDSGNKTYYWNM
jgi:hypothetical protein